MKHFSLAILTFVIVTSAFAETYCYSMGTFYPDLDTKEEKPHTEIRIKDGFITSFQYLKKNLIKGPTPAINSKGEISFKLDAAATFFIGGGPYYTGKLLKDKFVLYGPGAKMEILLAECIDD